MIAEGPVFDEPKPARARPHDKVKYKWRNQIERLFNKLKNWRRIATGSDKTKGSYLGFVAIAAAKLAVPYRKVPHVGLVHGA